MNVRQLEDAYKREVELISYKISLGELTQEEGGYLIEKARARSLREMRRIKRSSRMIFHLAATAVFAVFAIGFYEQYLINSGRVFRSQFWLYLMSGGLLFFYFAIYKEFSRIEQQLAPYFSKSLYRKILKGAESELLWNQSSVIQVRMNIKNRSHVEAGLKDQQLCELYSQILQEFSAVFDDGTAVLEQMDNGCCVIDYFCVPGHEKIMLKTVIEKVQLFYSRLAELDGEYFSKSIKMGASVVSGLLWAGMMGDRYRVFRTFGKKTLVGEALVQASSWDEILMDEETAILLEDVSYSCAMEPIFLKSSRELIRVHAFSGWKGVEHD
jgi:hypothetical protein